MRWIEWAIVGTYFLMTVVSLVLGFLVRRLERNVAEQRERLAYLRGKLDFIEAKRSNDPMWSEYVYSDACRSPARKE